MQFYGFSMICIHHTFFYKINLQTYCFLIFKYYLVPHFAQIPDMPELQPNILNNSTNPGNSLEQFSFVSGYVAIGYNILIA